MKNELGRFTLLQDHSVWRPLMDLLSGEPSLELQTVVTSTICNLLLEFSPAKEPMLESGAVEMLCELTKHPDPALRLNGSWALMNMAFQVSAGAPCRMAETVYCVLCVRIVVYTLFVPLLSPNRPNST